MTTPDPALMALAERLGRARCWYVGSNLTGHRFPPSKWFDLSPMDIAEAVRIIQTFAQEPPNVR